MPNTRNRTQKYPDQLKIYISQTIIIYKTYRSISYLHFSSNSIIHQYNVRVQIELNRVSNSLIEFAIISRIEPRSTIQIAENIHNLEHRPASNEVSDINYISITIRTC